MAPKPCSAPRSVNLLPAHLPTADHAGSLGLARSFELVKAEILQVPAHALVPIEIDVPRSARAVRGAATRLATLLPDLAKLGGYDLRPVRRLKSYAGAVLYTHVLALAAGPEDFRKLAMRDAAFVLFLEAYRHCRHGVMLLRWSEHDAGAYLPELYRRRPWALGERKDSRWTANGTLRLEAAAPSPIRHREVPMG
jgi:hypothetical protein